MSDSGHSMFALTGEGGGRGGFGSRPEDAETLRQRRLQLPLPERRCLLRGVRETTYHFENFVYVEGQGVFVCEGCGDGCVPLAEDPDGGVDAHSSTMPLFCLACWQCLPCNREKLVPFGGQEEGDACEERLASICEETSEKDWVAHIATCGPYRGEVYFENVASAEIVWDLPPGSWVVWIKDSAGEIQRFEVDG